jgi:hypothetical protein
MIKIIGIRVIDRIKETGFTQDVLSKYSGLITTRMGFHELNDGLCSREGFIILHLKGDPGEWKMMIDELGTIGGIEVKEMDFGKNSDQTTFEEIASGGVRILGVLINHGGPNARELQRILTLYGCSIRTRLGVNEVHFGEPAGLIILELKGSETEMERLEADLRALNCCTIRRMVFGS